MKVSVNQKVLLEGLTKVGKAITGKATLDVLKGVFIDANQKGIMLRGTDNDISIATLLKADVIEPGSVVLDYKLLLEVVRKLPNDNISIDLEKDEVQITCEKSYFSIITMDKESFPDIPKIRVNSSVMIQQSYFKQLVNKVCYAAAEDNTRPILQGVLVEIKNNLFNLVALDGYRLSLAKIRIDSDSEFSVVAQSKHLIEISKILDSKEIQISFNENHIIFKSANLNVMVRLLEGSYPQYTSLINDNTDKKVIVKRSELIDAIERATLLSNVDGVKRVVKLNINTEVVNILSKSTRGNSKESIELTSVEGVINDFDIAFNSKYLLDALRYIEDYEVTLHFSSSVQSCILRGTNADKELETSLVLPVRL